MTGTARPRRDGDPDGAAVPERWLTASDQRRALEGIARLIEQHCVFPEVASAVAAELRERPIRPGGIASSALARTLTAELRSHDRHFTVRWGHAAPRRRTADAGGEPAISFRREAAAGILTIRRFDDASRPVHARLADACLAQLEECDGVVIDVRGNPGGWPTMVEHILAPLLAPDPVHIVTFRSAGSPDHEAWTRPDGRFPRLRDLPLVVLLDERTASAAESLAYAVQTTGRGTVVGRPSVGAANPADAFDERSGFRVHIPTGAPIDPRTGTNWDGAGVQPAVVIASDADELRVAIEIMTRRLTHDTDERDA
ncbi:S41 family peptidase [Microbacterium sp.]|uniref:S41 family peptidase n=1 Tax=Microbacterium sp. TaxID=51671 RepID=UPI002810B763|nr:S41 family peptidase [Microbacterium sp.]